MKNSATCRRLCGQTSQVSFIHFFEVLTQTKEYTLNPNVTRIYGNWSTKRLNHVYMSVTDLYPCFNNSVILRKVASLSNVNLLNVSWLTKNLASLSHGILKRQQVGVQGLCKYIHLNQRREVCSSDYRTASKKSCQLNAYVHQSVNK